MKTPSSQRQPSLCDTDEVRSANQPTVDQTPAPQASPASAETADLTPVAPPPPPAAHEAPEPAPADITRDAPGTASVSAAAPIQTESRLEDLVKQFETGWQQGKSPRLEVLLSSVGNVPSTVMAELVRIDLEYRLKKGDTTRVEDYLQRFPELTTDPTVVVELIAAEYQLRQGGQEDLTTEEYVRRFPQHADALQARFSTVSFGGAQATPASDETNAWTGGPRAAPDLPALPGYQLLGTLGRGGMGVVYKARQVKLNRLVALKMILAGAHAAPVHLERFRLEGEAVARLQHPNIVQIYEVGESEGRPFFSLEFVDGGALDRRIAGTPQPVAEAATLVETLARAMQAAHDKGIVHRDLKPANVLVTATGVPKIADFGLAKDVEGDSSQTGSGAVMGTPSYMAPEQASGHTKEVGPAADIYALGAILYELLTGRPPFRGATALETIVQVKMDEPVPPRRLVPKVPKDLETICLKCLAKEPSRRYARALDLADDLHRWQEGEPIQARPVGAVERLVKRARRRPALAALVVALVLLVGVGVALTVQHFVQQYALLQKRYLVEADKNLTSKLKDEKKWDEAVEVATRNLERIKSEPSFTPLRQEVEDLYQAVKDGQNRQTQGRETQETLKTFGKGRNEVLLHKTATLSSAVGVDANLRTARAAAARSLAIYHVTPENDGPAVLPASFLSQRDQHWVRTACYELLLTWADAVSQPVRKDNEKPGPQAVAALQLLDRAQRLDPARTAQCKTYHLYRARYLAGAGRDAEAKQEQEQADALAPTEVVDFFLLGIESDKLGRSREAEQFFRKVLEKAPDHFWANYALAMCEVRKQRPDVALGYLTACVAAEPDFVWAYMLRALARADLRDFDGAEKDFDEAAKRALDEDARYALLVNRGVVLVRRGLPAPTPAGPPEKLTNAQQEKLLAGAELFEQAIKLQPEQYQAYRNLAEVWIHLDRIDEARAQLDKAIVLRPTGSLYRARARLWLRLNRQEEALEDLKAVITRAAPGEKSVSLAEDHLELGRILYRQEKFSAALAAFDAAVATHPGDYAFAHRLRSEALLELHRPKEVVEAVSRYLEKGKPEADVFRVRGLARAKLRDYTEAVEDFTQALELDRQRGKRPDATTLCCRGGVYLLLEAPRLAEHDFDLALKQDKNSADAYNGRGCARVLLGKHRQGVADAEAAVERTPVTARTLYNAARIFSQAAGKLEEGPKDRSSVDLRIEYQARAVELLRAAVLQEPPARRLAFWQEYAAHDPALRPLRRWPAFVKLAAEYPPGKK